MLDDLVPAFERLRQQGKTRFLGFTAIGDAAALHKVIDARVFGSAQVVYNMLNPSAAAGAAGELSSSGPPGTDQLLGNLKTLVPALQKIHWTEQEWSNEVSSAIIDFPRSPPS